MLTGLEPGNNLTYTVGGGDGTSGAAANDTANSNVPLTYTQEEHHKAIFDAVEGAVRRSNDNIVCSLIAMYRYGGVGSNSGHMPWKVEAETMRALMDVLERAGYTASGRRHTEQAPDNAATDTGTVKGIDRSAPKFWKVKKH